MKFKVKVIQEFRNTRTIETEIDAVSAQNARWLLANAEVDIPAFDDPNWKDENVLTSEYAVLVEG